MEKDYSAKTYIYNLPGDWEVLAGKTDTDNDLLSLKLANPKDYWFHVKGMPGSHVILRVKDAEPDRGIIKQAASIAAFHSKARNGGVTTVSYTLAQNVSKPKGAKPGTVTIRKESTIKVRPALPKSSES